MNRSSHLPNFIIIGAPKSGTTSLHYYLSQHPEIYLPQKKEMHYFTFEYLKNNANGAGDKNILTRLCATRKEYEKYYQDSGGMKAVGETSPSYLYYSDVSERILSELGPVKIIMILRDPVQKAFSQYVHMLREKRETLSFYEALMEERNRMKASWLDFWYYAESSLYSDRVKKYLSVFGENNVKIIIFEEFINATNEKMRELFQFLDVDENFYCDTTRRLNKSELNKSLMVSNLLRRPNLLKTIVKNILPEKIRVPVHRTLMELNSIEKPSIDPESKKYLQRYFSDDVDRLQKLLKRKIDWLG